MFGAVSRLAPLIHIQGDFLSYGIGGFSEYPRGWGLDIAHLNRGQFGGWFGADAPRYLTAECQRTAQSGILSALFVPAFVRRLYYLAQVERTAEQCRVRFEYARASIPSFRRYPDFVAFARECIGAVYGRTPKELLSIIEQRIEPFWNVQMERSIKAQMEATEPRHAQDILRRVCIECGGSDAGLKLHKQVLEAFGGRIASLSQLMPMRKESVLTALKAWHWQQCQHWSDPAVIAAEWKQKRWPQANAALVRRASRDTREALASLPRALCELVGALELPIFVATDENANFFRFLHGSVPLAFVKDQEELQEYTVLGLCMYQPYYRGGIIVTHGGRKPGRFWHTLAEELSHLTDGPTDRGGCMGHHRYSGSAAFAEALVADRAALTPWQRNKALGVKEWGQALTLAGINRFTRARVMRRIEAYDAALDFDHYAPEERNAEIFAALPVVEKALGKRLARRMMPNLFHFLETHCYPALRREIADLHQI